MTSIEKTIVVFRAERSRPNDVTAVFPYEPADYAGRLMSCYAHIGQHSSCSMSWYRTTRAAKPHEYADLKAELENYGSSPESRYILEVRQRIPHNAHDKRQNNRTFV
jgi:hypothetical protein